MVRFLDKAMDTLGVVKKADLLAVQGELSKAQKEMENVMEMVIKPDHRYYRQDTGIQPLLLPVRMIDLYNLANVNSVLRTITVNLKNEIFRQPPVWKPKFVVKCNNCGHEHQQFVENCIDCGSPSLREPNMTQLDRFEEFIDKANKNGMTLKNVLKQCEDDLNIADDMYLILIKEYVADGEGIMYERVKEIIRGDPVIMRIVSNEKGEIGNRWWICPHHRDIPYDETETDEHSRTLGRIYEQPGKCEKCGRNMLEVHYVSVHATNEGKDAAQFYLEGEVIHTSKYSPSLLYGYPPVISVWKESTTILNMTNYVNEYYRYKRAPNGALFVSTMNPESMYKKWDEIQERLRVDPLYTPLIAVQGESSSKGNRVEFVKFMDSLQEMGYIEGKDDIRQRISALYGVTNILMNDSGTSGGLNNEGLQIKVTDRAVETGQNVWNENVFPRLLQAFSITDWTLTLQPNEETDKMKRVQLKTAEAQYAQIMQNMGFKVEKDEDNNFVFSGEAIDMGEQQRQEQEMAMQQQSGEGFEGGDAGMVDPGEEPEDASMNPEYDAEGGHYHDYFFDVSDTDKRKPENKGSGEALTISNELTKVEPWRRSMANGYRKIEIVRRDGQRQGVWVKDISDEEYGKKRDTQSADTHGTLTQGTRNKLNIQRRPHQEFKREGVKTRMEMDEAVNDQIESLPPEKQLLLDEFVQAHQDKDLDIKLTDAENGLIAELQGHAALFKPETGELILDSDLSSQEMKVVLGKYNEELSRRNEH